MTPPFNIFARPVFTVKVVGSAAAEVEAADTAGKAPFPEPESLMAITTREQKWLQRELIVCTQYLMIGLVVGSVPAGADILESRLRFDFTPQKFNSSWCSVAVSASKVESPEAIYSRYLQSEF